jgi:AcrR family transcriptional regulator
MTPGRATDASAPTLRSDAERNRQAIVRAAREVFAEQGVDAPMAVIARRAEVGIATLFRRFPERDDLVAAVFGAQMTAYADAVEMALADPDPWQGFCRYVERVCAMQAADRGFTDVLTMTFPMASALEGERSRAFRGFRRLVARAKDAGRLRRDFSDKDLIILLMANAGVVTATQEIAPGASPRLVAYLLQAFDADHTKPLPPVPRSVDLVRAMKQGHPTS